MDAAPQTGDFGKMKTTAWDASRTGAQESRDAFKKMLAGRCFRCLRPDHMVAQCRDPVCCLICKESGHLARHCKNRRHQPISTSLRQRLIFPSGNIHSRIAFPPLRHPITANPPPTSLTSQPPAKIATIVASPHNVYCSSTSEVAYALSQQLHVLCHNIMVTSHKPGGFVVEFKLTPVCHAGMEDMEPMGQGRPISRSPIRGRRVRDYLPHVAEEWERRRSRSPMRQNTTSAPSELHQAWPVSHDPLADPHRMMTTPDSHFFGPQDPMMMEANCHAVLSVTRPCSYPDDGGEDTRSTERTSDEVNSREIDVALLGSSVGRSVSSDLAVVPVMASAAAAKNIADEHADL